MIQRAPRDVARRALVSAALVCRGYIDLGVGDPEPLHSRLLGWLHEVGLHDGLEPREREIIDIPQGRLDQRDVIWATWEAEALSVLAWALGDADLAPHDRKVNPIEIANAVGLFDAKATEAIESSILRATEKLSALRELLYAIHVRLVEYRRAPQSRDDFMDSVEPEWLASLGIQPDKLTVDGDLSIEGDPLAEAPAEKRQNCEWLTGRRHRAAIWLIDADNEQDGYWDITPDT